MNQPDSIKAWWFFLVDFGNNSKGWGLSIQGAYADFVTWMRTASSICLFVLHSSEVGSPRAKSTASYKLEDVTGEVWAIVLGVTVSK